MQDISNNKLKDISALDSLSHILTLKADKNLLKSAKMSEVSIDFLVLTGSLVSHLDVLDVVTLELTDWKEKKIGKKGSYLIT